jgi:hypothetical protein
LSDDDDDDQTMIDILDLVYRHGNWLYTMWQKVRVGDIVKVIDKEFFPADLVLLSSGFVIDDRSRQLAAYPRPFLHLANPMRSVTFRRPIWTAKPT